MLVVLVAVLGVEALVAHKVVTLFSEMLRFSSKTFQLASQMKISSKKKQFVVLVMNV